MKRTQRVHRMHRLGTYSTSRPKSSTGLKRLGQSGLERLAHPPRLRAPVDACPYLPRELLATREDRRVVRLRYRSDRLPRHVLRAVAEQAQADRLARPRRNAVEDLGGPGGAFTALRVLGARR